MKLEDAFPSKYLKAADLKGCAIVVEIENAPCESLKGLDGTTQNKTVLHFKGKEKTLPLNRTNFVAVAKATGEADSEDWPGHKIELYPTTTSMKGEEIECIRIRAPSRKAAAQASKSQARALAEEMNDDIPF